MDLHLPLPCLSPKLAIYRTPSTDDLSLGCIYPKLAIYRTPSTDDLPLGCIYPKLAIYRTPSTDDLSLGCIYPKLAIYRTPSMLCSQVLYYAWTLLNLLMENTLLSWNYIYSQVTYSYAGAL